MATQEQKRALAILEKMKAAYPSAQIALQYSTPMQLLCAVIMSAQTTDEQVNKVNESLFKKYKSVRDFASVDESVFEKEISSVNFFRNKARNIVKTARIVQEKYNGAVPRTIDELVELPGVGRKTANIVLWELHGVIAGVVVDTHVKRVSLALGFTKNKDPVKVEQDLMRLFPQKEWGMIGHYFQAYGRTVLRARGKPLMEDFLKQE
ncbi:MAG: endonuclease III [Candidatus Spechtbacteria bacterium SB0662_bin_43]|uniref:Endonuclease III n=1 Tax=Candidatus Spechtbacteria bacterium SB0662_bin_43 TaxID=2604897 RepID=A0A845DB46_9BACT|nr:endonuclease III [Candidatus Spechtbacteria bacterium SB0662_bin_43]